MKGRAVIHAEAIRLRAEVQEVIARFVEAEIDTGLLFCQIANERDDGARRKGLLKNARKAHDVAQEWIWKLRMPHHQFDQMTAKLEKLRITLNRT
jgi:hypothetical protein